MCYGIIGALLLGLSCCTLFYEVTKSCVGSLRPYFFAVCRPTLNVTNCTDTHRYMYITDYDCTTSNGDQLIDARYMNLINRRSIGLTQVHDICVKEFSIRRISEKDL